MHLNVLIDFGLVEVGRKEAVQFYIGDHNKRYILKDNPDALNAKDYIEFFDIPDPFQIEHTLINRL